MLSEMLINGNFKRAKPTKKLVWFFPPKNDNSQKIRPADLKMLCPLPDIVDKEQKDPEVTGISKLDAVKF